MTKSKGKTLDDLRATHDRTVVVPNRIRLAITALKDSGDQWAYESDFMQLVKPPIGTTDIARYREQFTDFWAELPGTNGKSSIRRAWFPTKELAAKWKETVSG